MKINKFVQVGFQTLIIMSLLFTNISNVAAQGGGGGDYLGQVSVSESKSLPPPKGSNRPNGATQPLPGGGTATATAQLSWNQSVMDGIARNSLSSGAIGTHNLCARVIQLYMNSAPQGGYTTPACGNRIAGGSILQKKTKVVTSVFGKTWQVNTDHTFTKPGWSGWYTGLQAGPISL